MRIIYWSDFNCPNSYIGLVRLKRATDELDLDVEWEMKPFELYPTLFNKPTNSITTQNIIKYGITPEDAKAKIEETEKIALNDGLRINYKDIQLTSSRNAHRLVRYVQKKHSNLSQDLIFKIFEANFIDNKIIADIDTLVEIASSLGLDDIEIRNMLESDSYDFEVRVEEEEAMIMGVEAIPLYFLNISEEQLIQLGKDLFHYFLYDDYARKFRKMLTMAAYHDKELSEAYMKHYVDDPLSYQGMLLGLMVQEGVLHTEDVEIMTLHFYAPIYMLLTACDRDPDRAESAVGILEKHIRQFNRLYGRKTD